MTYELPRTFWSPDGEQPKVVEVLGISTSGFANLWDGQTLYRDVDIGRDFYRISPANFDRYPLGQRAGEAKK